MKKIAIYTENYGLLKRIIAICDNLGCDNFGSEFKPATLHLPYGESAAIILNPVDFNLLRLSVYGDYHFIAHCERDKYDVYYADHYAEYCS